MRADMLAIVSCFVIMYIDLKGSPLHHIVTSIRNSIVGRIKKPMIIALILSQVPISMHYVLTAGGLSRSENGMLKVLGRDSAVYAEWISCLNLVIQIGVLFGKCSDQRIEVNFRFSWIWTRLCLRWLSFPLIATRPATRTVHECLRLDYVPDHRRQRDRTTLA